MLPLPFIVQNTSDDKTSEKVLQSNERCSINLPQYAKEGISNAASHQAKAQALVTQKAHFL